MNGISIEELYSIYKEHPIISKDTRQITRGCIYFALKGDNFNGNIFAEDALNKGAAYVVVDEKKYKKNDQFILVENSLEALQQLAIFHRNNLNIPIIGITGSNGKTTTKELVAAVLSQKFNTRFTKGNYNNHIGVPLTILQISSKTEIAVIEMGANHIGEIESLCQIANPNFGLITNIGKAHLEGFGGIEGIKKGKSELYRHLALNNGKIFLNDDDDVLKTLLPKVETILYGKKNDLFCNGKLDHSYPSLHGYWRQNDFKGVIDSTLYGEYNFYNILAAICIGSYFGVQSGMIENAINSYKSEINRSQKIEKEGNIIYLDAYNANPTSMSLAIKNFENSNHKKKVAILGDMFELGKEAPKEHLNIIELIKSSTKINRTLFVGENFYFHKKDLKDIYFFKTSEEAKNWFLQEGKEDEAFLIKGSRGMKMENIIA